LTNFTPIGIVNIRDNVLIIKIFGGRLMLKDLWEYAMSPTALTFENQKFPLAKSLSTDDFRGRFPAPAREIVNLPKLIPSLHKLMQPTWKKIFRQHKMKSIEFKYRVKMHFKRRP